MRGHSAAVVVVVLLAAVTVAEEKCSAEIKAGIQQLYEAFMARDAGDGGGIGKLGLSIIVDNGVVSSGSDVINVVDVNDNVGTDGSYGTMDSVELVKAKYVLHKLKMLIGDSTVGASVRAADNDQQQMQPDSELTAAEAAADVPSSQVESHCFVGCSADRPDAMSMVGDTRESAAPQPAAVHGTPESGYVAAALSPPPPPHAAIDQLEQNFLDALARIERLRETSPVASAAAVAAASAGAVPSSVPGHGSPKKAGKRRHLGRASKLKSHATPPPTARRPGRFLNLFKFNKSRGLHNTATIAATVATHV